MNKEKVIEVLYDNLVNTINDQEKIIIDDSVYITIQQSRFNLVTELLKDSSIDKTNLDQSTYNSLSIEEKIYDMPNDKISISAVGIYYYEKRKKDINEDKLVKYYDKKLKKLISRDDTTSNKLSDKEKIVVLAMLCTRAFSRDHCINGNDSYKRLDIWYMIFKKCNQFLIENELGKLYNGLDSKRLANHHTVDGICRRIDKLPVKTNQLVHTGGGKKEYFLKVADSGNKINIDDTALIFKVIGENKYDTYKSIYEFCRKIYLEYFPQLFDTLLFQSVEYDRDLKKSFLKALAG